MNTASKEDASQASVPNDLVHNVGTSDSPVGATRSHGSGGDVPIPVLVDLLRSMPHLTSKEPEAIMRLFIRLENVNSLG